MKITLTIDTDDFNYHVDVEGEITTSKDVRQLVSLGRLAVVELQNKVDEIAQNVATLEQAAEKSLQAKAEVKAKVPANMAEHAAQTVAVANKAKLVKKGRR